MPVHTGSSPTAFQRATGVAEDVGWIPKAPVCAGPVAKGLRPGGHPPSLPGCASPPASTTRHGVPGQPGKVAAGSGKLFKSPG